MSDSPNPTLTARLRLRWVAFVSLVVLLNAGPFYRNAVDDTARTLDWDMFSAKGLNRCAVRYFEADGDRLRSVDGLAALGYRQRQDAPVTGRQPPDVATARAVATRVCRALGPGTDLRITLDCASPQGWIRRIESTEPMCAF